MAETYSRASVFDIQYRMEVDLNLVFHFQPIPPMHAVVCIHGICICVLCVYIFRSRQRNLSYLYSFCILWSSFIFMEKHIWCEESVATATLLLLKNRGNEIKKAYTRTHYTATASASICCKPMAFSLGNPLPPSPLLLLLFSHITLEFF